jgi:hypothetical protein
MQFLFKGDYKLPYFLCVSVSIIVFSCQSIPSEFPIISSSAQINDTFDTGKANNDNDTSSPTLQYIVPAIIAAIASGAAAIVSAWNQIKLKKLEEIKAEKDARRAYEYEARKRLYQEFEPALFQLVDLSDSALRRIKGLARESKDGFLTPGQGWLSNDDAYYMKNTIYRFIAPLAVFSIIQRRLTTFDLNLDSCIEIQYILTKALYQTFSKDFPISRSKPTLPYNPHGIPGYEQTNVKDLQGLYMGVVDQLAEALIKEEPGNKLRIISYGEFENKYIEFKKKEHFRAIIDLLLDFYPKNRKVLWRILLAQAHIYMAIIRVSKISPDSCKDLKPLKIIPKGERKDFDWSRNVSDTKSDDSYTAVEDYFRSDPELVKVLE